MNVSLRNFLIQTMENAINSPLGVCLSPMIKDFKKIHPEINNFFEIQENLKENKYHDFKEWLKDVHRFFTNCIKICGSNSDNGLGFQTLFQLMKEQLSSKSLINSDIPYTPEQKEAFFHHFQAATVNAPNSKKQFIAGSDVTYPSVRPKELTNAYPEPFFDTFQIQELYKRLKYVDSEKKSRHYLHLLRSYETCGKKTENSISFDLGLVSSYTLDLIRQELMSEDLA